jgi:transcriptional regulator with XRE-family HTH domain
MDPRHSENEEVLANPIREARLRAGLSQLALAEKAGLSLAWVGTVERAPTLVSRRVALRLAEVLGIQPEALLASSAMRRTLLF